MFDLGQMYLQGKVHPGDEREEDQFIGRHLIEDAAYNGNVLAQYNMGYYFLKMAKGTSYELDEAERFFKMAENKRTETQKVGPFIPTNEWQEVLPGQAVPKVIMNA